jgi:cytochrome c oxidase subunit 2
VVERYGGPGAEHIGELFWAMLLLGGIVFVLFCAALAYALVHGDRADTGPTPERDLRGGRTILLLGGIVPAVVLIPLFIWTVRTLDALDPRARPPDLVVHLTGKQWWWEVRYHDPDPTRGFVTANEIHIPTGRRVELRLASTDVIHSFWVPELQGKTDLIPGRTNVTWIQADRPGVYGGRCAEYCGTQHATMGLLVVAQRPEEFRAWADGQRQAAAAPSDSLTLRGRDAFAGSACAACHTVRGTSAGGRLGPDLTHVASRRTLAARLLPNTPGHLGGWIANPQALKPGSRMPRVPMSPEEFTVIHHYLQTLD